MARFGLASTLAIGILSLQACKGSGGGGVAPFISFDSLGPGDRVVAKGDVAFATYDTNLNTGATVAGPTQNVNGEARIGVDNALNISSLDISTFDPMVRDNASAKWDVAKGDQIASLTPAILFAMTNDGQDIGLFADPAGLGFNYQSFGAWLTNYNKGEGIVAVGSFGAPTSAANVPTVNIATYDGAASGFALDATQTPFFVLSNAQIDVDFGAGTFAFFTTGSMVDNLVDANPLTFVNDPGYDLVGDGNISNATFAGNVDAVHDLTGTVSGKFFGPNAQELGGTFDLAGPDGRYTGSFGAVD